MPEHLLQGCSFGVAGTLTSLVDLWTEKGPGMNEANSDAICSDSTVRLRCYLPLASSLWFGAGCGGLAGCSHVAPVSDRLGR